MPAARLSLFSGSSPVRSLRAGRDRWRRLGCGHEPVYVVSPAGNALYAFHHWGLRELDVGSEDARERHVVLRAVL
jgi:hypothetical protein